MNLKMAALDLKLAASPDPEKENDAMSCMGTILDILMRVRAAELKND